MPLSSESCKYTLNARATFGLYTTKKTVVATVRAGTTGPSLQQDTSPVFADEGAIIVKGHGFAQGVGSLDNFVTITSPKDMDRGNFNVQNATATQFKVQRKAKNCDPEPKLHSTKPYS